MKNPTFLSNSKSSTALAALAAFAALLIGHSAHAQFSQTGAGPWDYNNTANWTGGVINGNFTATPTTALTTVTFAADTVLTTGLNFNYNASSLGRGFALIGSGADRTITLGGNLTVDGSGGQRTVTIGSTTAGQNVNIDLGGVTRTFIGTTAGGLAFRTLNLVNVISNGGITTDDSKSGDSQLTLSGENTYAGGTTIFDGYYLNINNGGTSSSNSAIGTGTLTLRNAANIDNTSGSSVMLLTNNAQTWGNGTGGFTYRGSNALNLGTGAVTLGGTTTVTTTNNTLTVGGVISGAFGVAKAGNGTLALTNAASTYTGTTSIAGGVLEVTKLSNAGVASSIGAPTNTDGNTVLNGAGILRYVGTGDSTNRRFTIGGGGGGSIDASGTGAIIFTNTSSSLFASSNVPIVLNLIGNSTADNTYAANQANNGTGAFSIVKSGVGKWILSGNNTYNGTTTISAGTLQIGSGGTTGSLSASSAITNNGTLVFNRSNSVVQGTHFSAAAITGSGDLTQSGTGNLTLNAANTYTGVTTINSGTLIASGGSAIADTGAVTLANASGALFSITGNETIGSLRGGGNAGGNVSVAASQTLTVAEIGNQAFSGSIQGSGALTKTGLGTLGLNGANTYSGATTISAGTLLINGSTSAASEVLVFSGATLGGDGVLNGATIIDGRHSPGNSPGIQTFSSNLTYGSGATVLWELNQNSVLPIAYDQVRVGGSLNISGSTVINLSFNTPGSSVDWSDAFWNENQSWTIYSLTNGGAISGLENLSIGVEDWLDSQGDGFNQFLSGGSFSVSGTENSVLLNYAAVPEPGTWALLVLAGVFVLASRIRRHSNQTQNKI